MEAGARDVLSLDDELNIGAIAELDPVVRAREYERVIGVEVPADAIAEDHAFWREVRAGSKRLVVWASGTNAKDRSGLLAVASEVAPSRPLSVIDVSRIPHTRPIVSVGSLSAEFLRGASLQNVEISVQQRELYREQWRTLAGEMQDLRILVDDELVSTEVSIFDALILETLGEGAWKSTLWVATDVLNYFYDSGLYQVDLELIVTRLGELIDGGLVVQQGGADDTLDARTLIRRHRT